MLPAPTSQRIAVAARVVVARRAPGPASGRDSGAASDGASQILLSLGQLLLLLLRGLRLRLVGRLIVVRATSRHGANVYSNLNPFRQTLLCLGNSLFTTS